MQSSARSACIRKESDDARTGSHHYRGNSETTKGKSMKLSLDWMMERAKALEAKLRLDTPTPTIDDELLHKTAQEIRALVIVQAFIEVSSASHQEVLDAVEIKLLRGGTH